MQYSSSQSSNYSTSMKKSPSGWKGKDGQGYMYKKSSYSYDTSGTGQAGSSDRRIDDNVVQLDELLEDLKNEREITTSKDMLTPTTATYRTIERKENEPYGTVTKTTKVIKTSKQSNGNYDLGTDLEDFGGFHHSVVKKNDYPSLQREREIVSERVRGTIEGGNRNYSGNVYESKSEVIENSRAVTPSLVSSTSKNLFEKDMQNIPLTEDILPLPGTKVTTTVRTYTYEVPSTDSTTHILRNNQTENINYNTTSTHHLSQDKSYTKKQQYQSVNVPPSVVYNTETYSTIDKRTGRPVVANQVYEVREHRETSTVPPTYNPLEPDYVGPRRPTDGTSKTITYNVSTTENIHSGPAPGVPVPYDEKYNQINYTNEHRINKSVLPPQPTTNRYFYKESSNVVNTVHGPPPSTTHYPIAEPPRNDHPGPGPSTISYTTYSSQTTSKHPGPNYRSAPLPPAPFPVDTATHLTPVSDHPPQRVEELIQSLETVDMVDKSQVEPTIRKREIETAVATPNQPHVPTVNRAGKEIYYPPGHDMMLRKREEMSAASAAGGQWAKGSGMYEYESGYKSKSKTKSGGAMVPVCLPLCCAMPCSIM